MAFGPNRRGAVPLRAQLYARIGQARINLLIVFILTVLNIIFAAFGSGTYFLFSASVPYFIALLGAMMCGLLPPEYYAEAGALPGEFLPEGMIVGFLLVAVGIAAIYLLAFLLSKKHTAFLLVSFILFIIDTAAMFLIYNFTVDMLIDLAIHAWVLVELFLGVRAVGRLKQLPADFPDDGIPFVNPVSPDDNDQV